MIENVAGKALTSRPGKGPERRRQADLTQIILGLLPELRRLIGKIELDFRCMGYRQETRLGPDERWPIEDQAHRASQGSAQPRPPTVSPRGLYSAPT